MAAVRAVEREFALLQQALEASADAGKGDEPVSAASAAVIAAAEDTKTAEWQVAWSNATALVRTKAVTAANEFCNSRKARLGLRGTGDVAKAAHSFIADRMAMYSNYLNRRGSSAIRRVLPSSRATASSAWDWDAAVEAKLLFAVVPNLNPREPVPGAKHARA